MKKRKARLIIISRDTLLEALQSEEAQGLFRDMAALSRRGHRILLTAPEPDRWVPTRKTVDGALDSQRDLTEKARTEGADIEGIYYVPRSLLTQDRNREGALKDILARYAMKPDQATLISSSQPFLRAASRLDIDAIEVKGDDTRSLKKVLASLG
ncbi:MAG: hypothetical protein HKN15_04175 [Xanthomonadales bacterium]|nr:hypothetical protein [Xanthomonadales bacterium]